MADNFRQDLPPVGGYPGINFTRAIPKQRFSAMTVIVGSLSIMTFGWVVAIRSNRERRVLRAMIEFEAEEALIMKDVPGWKVGKSVYHTEKWMPPHPAQLKEPSKDYYK